MENPDYFRHPGQTGCIFLKIPWQSWVDNGIPQAVNVPCQVVQAVWDGSGNHQEAKNVIVPNRELVSLQGCGHFVGWEKQPTPGKN